ncbi:hypothetical protein [Nocardia sp. AG03]|nr:hypothetical protein [Nocardia sp. AG03]
MKVNQYSYFSVKSTELSAVEIAARLGMEPDEVLVRRGRNPERGVTENS